jgi:hypothetical protein
MPFFLAVFALSFLGRTASTRIIGRLAFVHGKAATKTN